MSPTRRFPFPMPPGPQQNPDRYDAAFTDYQLEFILDQHDLAMAQWGVAAGKTVAGCVKTIVIVHKWPSIRILHCSPTYAMFATNVWPILVDMDQTWHTMTGRPLIKRFRKHPNWQIEFTNGSIMLIYSGENPERIRGPTVGAVWIDEISSMDQDMTVLENCQSRRRGWGPQITYITGTPAGDVGAVGHILARYRAGDPNVFLSRVASFENPYLSEKYLRSLKTMFSEAYYRQEVLAEALAAVGIVYETFTRKAHMTRFDPRREFQRPGWKVVVGVDWGTHWRHAVFMAVRGPVKRMPERVVVFHEIAQDQGSDYDLAEAIVAYAMTLRVKPTVIGVGPAAVDIEPTKDLIRLVKRTGHRIAVRCERNKELYRLGRSVELVRRLLVAGDGTVRLQYADSLLDNGWNGMGQRGIIQGKERWRRKRNRDKTYTNSPHDDSFLIHAQDAERYGILQLPWLGYILSPPPDPTRVGGDDQVSAVMGSPRTLGGAWEEEQE